MREQIAIEGRVVVEEVAQVQRGPSGGELVEADLTRGDLGPVALLRELMLRVGSSLADCLEDHASMLAAASAPDVRAVVGRVTTGPARGRPMCRGRPVD